jgi:signal transduction histidine kinase
MAPMITADIRLTNAHGAVIATSPARGVLDERKQEILQVCREDTARLDRLMRELLDLSTIESGAVTPQLVPTRPATLLADAANALRLQVEAGTRIDLHVYRPLGWRKADPMRLLIVDDEPHIRHMMRLTLEATGIR